MGVINSRDSVFVQGFVTEGEKTYFVDVGIPGALPKRKVWEYFGNSEKI
jgi:hypothetical protein